MVGLAIKAVFVDVAVKVSPAPVPSPMPDKLIVCKLAFSLIKRLLNGDSVGAS